MSKAPFDTLSSEIVFKNRWIRLVRDAVRGDDGHEFEYTYLSVADSVMVVGLTADGRIPIIRQYRYPSKSFNYELPGGGTAGRGAEEAAREELLEETGYRAGRIEKIGDFVTYCGLADETCHVIYATELEPGPQQLERTERIELRLVTLAELEAMIAAGEFRDGMGLAALRLAWDRLRAGSAE